jgi:starch synthase
MRVAFISAECEPWAKTGGLGDVVDALARALGRSRSIEGRAAGDGRAAGASEDAVDGPVEVFLPRYRGMEIPAEARSGPRRVPDPWAPGGTTDVSIVEFRARGYRVRLVDHAPAFDRDGLYGDAGGDYPDNGWRFGLLCRAAIEALRADARPLDVLHLHDWQAMPAALLRDCAYLDDPLVAGTAIVATIHNLAYQGWLSRSQASGLAFDRELDRVLDPAADGILLLRQGVERAELVNTVSAGYAREIVTPAFGLGMDPALAALGDRFGGILNGLDTTAWDPATDPALPAPYSRSNMAGKAACRAALLAELGFDPADKGPVLGMIGRLDPQKGFDLLAGAAPGLVETGARIVVLGTGDHGLVRDLRSLAASRPRSVAVVETFDRGLARRIYAGADLYLMPSRFEPCGQGQMIAMRYGTPPVVHRTGGLADTVADVDEVPADGTGFVFDELTPGSLAEACRRAIEHRARGGPQWAALTGRGMSVDWSWESGPAYEYAEAYRRAIQLRRQRRPSQHPAFMSPPRVTD